MLNTSQPDAGAPWLVTEDALASLRNYSWPGNLRELRNAVERAVILARNDRIASGDLPAEMRLENVAAANPEAAVGTALTLEKLEELHIRKVLERVPNLGKRRSVGSIRRRFTANGKNSALNRDGIPC